MADLYPTRENINVSPGIMPSGDVSMPSSTTPDKAPSYMYPTGAAVPQMPITVTMKELYEGRRFPFYDPAKGENEFAYGQPWINKMLNALGKGIVLTGTTFVNSTAGLLYGAAKWAIDGKFSSFYDNELTRGLDSANKALEDRILPNYYTDEEKNAHWYSPKKLFTTNFIFDGIIKNLGFSAGAALAGGVYAAGLKAFSALPGISRLMAVGKMEEALKMSTGIRGMSDKFLSSYNMLNPAGRAVVAGLSTFGEAGMESLQNLNQYRDTLIEDYKNTHNGEEPVGEALKLINDNAERVGNASFGLNTALLSATNYIQFPKILGSSYSAEKGISNDVIRRIGKIVEKDGKYAAVEKSTSMVARAGRTIGKVRPYVFSTSEAFEEGAQYAIQTGTQHYYNKKDGESSSILDSVIEGVRQTIGTDEGMENVLIGGLSGAIMLGYGKYRERSAKEYNTKEAVSAFNKFRLSSFTKDTFDSISRGVTLQQEREKAIKEGRVSDSKDLETDYIINYLSPRIKYGRYDLVTSEIEAYRQLASTADGFDQLVREGKALPTDSPEAYLNRLDLLAEMASDVKSLYQSMNLRFGGILNEKGKPKYSSVVLDKMVYASAKIADYDRRISSLTPKLIGVGILTGELKEDVIAGNTAKYDAAVAAIKALKSPKEEDLLNVLEDVSAMTLRRDKFLNEYNEMKESPEKYNVYIRGEEDEDEEKEEAPKKEAPATVKIKTKIGEKDIEIGEEYFLGRVVEYDKEGHEVYRSPRITILGQNDDGTLKVRDVHGNVRDISPDVLEDYKLGKVSAVKDNPIARFFMENWNTVVEQKLKGGKRRKGRLAFEDGKLYFVYRVGKKGKGYTKQIPITLNSFKAQKGYREGVFTLGRILTPSEEGHIKKYNEDLKSAETAKIYDLNNREEREQVIIDLYNDLKARQASIETLVKDIKDGIEITTSEIEALKTKIESNKQPTTVSKKGIVSFKPTIKRAMESVKTLTEFRDDLQQELEELLDEQADIEGHIYYLEDIKSNLSELPETAKEILDNLDEDIILLELTVEDASAQISVLEKIIDELEKIIKDAIDFLSDILNEFEKKYPKVPRIIGNEWIEFLKNNPHFLKLKPNYRADLKELDDLVASVEDVDINVNQEKLNALSPKLESLKKELASAEKELKVRKLISERFTKAIKDYEDNVKQRQKDVDPADVKAALGTASKNVVHTRNIKEDEYFEAVAKKADDFIWRATMGIIRGNKPHQLRANRFGFNLDSFKNRKDIRGVYVTASNESVLGLSGLMDYIAKEADETIDKNDVIALVMVDSSGATPAIVNERGQRITENLLDNVIFQVFPSKELRWKNGESMFRKTTEEDTKKAIIAYYTKFREDVKKNATLQTNIKDIPLHTIGASFGFPTISYKRDENNNIIKKNDRAVIDYSTRTSVKDAGLVKDEDFDSRELLYVPTLDENVTYGTTYYVTEKGRPFLRTPNGDVPLQNRRHTKEEAQVIFDVIHLLAKNMTTPGVGLLDKATGKINDKCLPLINWLESVVYWGLPANEVGYNSVFWKKDENDKFVLTLSGKDELFPFTPIGLEENKDMIMQMLEGMYINVNNWRSKKLTEPYTEIVQVKPSGELVTRDWLNYQTFLLSGKFIASRERAEGDGSKRENVPLSTVILPMKDENDVNRTGIYFFTEDNKGEVEIMKVPTVVTAGKPKKAETTAPVLDGKTKNTFVGKTGRTIVYTADEDGNITILREGDINLIINETGKNIKKQNPSMSDEEIVEKAKVAIKEVVKKSVFPEGVKKTEEEEETFVIGELVKEEAEEKDVDTFVVGDLANEIDDIIKNTKADEEREEYRVIVEEQKKKFETEDWPKIEKWIKANLPNIPVYRVKNIIMATNGGRAWGMFKKGAIYVYENAEVGTIYHEAFEAIWKMSASPEEQKAIIDEFRQRKGTFIDRPTGEKLKYSEATPQQIKEQLAEEFRDYVQYRKIPVKPEKGRPYILKLFYDIYNLIKQFFFGQYASRIEEMFHNINTGYYKEPMEREIVDIDEAFATSEDELRPDIDDRRLSDKQRGEIMESMTYYTLFDLIEKDENLFTLKEHIEKNKTQLYTFLRGKILRDVAIKYGENGRELMLNIGLDWNNIIRRHEEYLRQYDIEFDENDELQIRDENKIRESDFVEGNKIDHLKKANRALKMLLSTIPFTNANDGKWIRSTVGGPKLMPLNRVYVTLLNNLHSARTVEEMMYKLREMAKDDNNYKGLYKRLTKRDWGHEINATNVDLSHITNKYSERLLSAFYSLFKKSQPEVKTLTIFDNGEINVGDTYLSTFAAQLKDDFVNNMVYVARNGSKYFVYDAKKKTFSGNVTAISNAVLPDNSAMVNFLADIGIVFKLKDVQSLPKEKAAIFREAVTGIRKSIREGSDIATISGRVLKLNNRLLDLGYIQASIDHPIFDNTFFNISGERTQTYIGTNPASDLYDALSQINNLDELIDTRYEYLITDTFSQGSSIINRMFARSGRKIDNDEARHLMRTAYISGTENLSKGRRKESARLSQKERLVQELNMNIYGYYLNLVPGDATMEHAIYMGNAITEESIRKGMIGIHNVFMDYFIAELNTVREYKIREDSMGKFPNGSRRNAREMRFFKGILGEDLHRDIMAISDSAEKVYNDNKGRIDAAVTNYINQQNIKLENTLRSYGIIETEEDGSFIFNNVAMEKSINKDELKNRLTFLSANYMIANIELHKLIYSDPYQYADELKRIKNFNSPRQSLVSIFHNDSVVTPVTSLLNRVWNRDFKKGDAGWTDFIKGYFKTATYADITGISKTLPGYQEGWKETDGGGMITLSANRQIGIRIGQWSDNEERQYLHDMGYEELIKNGATEEELLEYEKKNPAVRSAYTPRKPIVSGGQWSDVPYNKIVLDKFALYPMSRRLADAINRAGGKKTSTLVSLYDKMRKDDVDYVVFESSRKVGVRSTDNFYNANGSFNTGDFTSVVNIPFSIISIQSEVPSKDETDVTRGTQITKLVTMDFMDAGVPVDFMPEEENIIKRYKAWAATEDKEEKSALYKEIKHNQKLLTTLIELGYRNTLDKLGIEETFNKERGQKEYSIKDLSIAGNTLRDEIIKREVSDNISDALQAFLEGKSVLEATPAFQQMKNIIYSIADKEVMSQRIHGSMKVQISSAGFEENRIEEAEINGKKGFVSDVLKFYEKDGENICEIMMGRWFDSDMTDKELLDYLNTTDEGKSLLRGIAFRIPTQKQNSIDRYVIKQFLPREFGDSVVVPSGIVNKAGSDFDIDKLTIYLKHVMMEGKDIKPVPYYGMNKEATAKFAEIAASNIEKDIETIGNKILKQEELQELFNDIALGIASSKTAEKWIPIFKTMYADILVDGKLPVYVIRNLFLTRIRQLDKRYDKLTNNDMKEMLKYEETKRLYRQSLENEYISSMERLVSHDANYDRLIKPNSADQLKKLAKEISGKTVGSSFEDTNVANMLDRTFMSRLRHAFVTGKYAIGIAAVNNTNHSLNQRQLIFIDPRRRNKLSDEDAKWLGDAGIKFKEYNKVEIEGIGEVATLSMIRNAEGQDISEIISQFIDGYVDISKGPWIMELGATPNVTSTWLFLAKIGVPIDTVAYFMNQPIIRDYLHSIEVAGYSWLFMDNFVSDMLDNYDPKAQSVEETKANEEYEKTFTIPSKTKLQDLVGKKAHELTNQQRLDQQLMLKEFVKYAKMAEHMFNVTQGSNFDTATFNDPYLVFKKFKQLEKAQKSIISDVDELLANSFVGKLGKTVKDIRNALATIIKSDSSRIRKIIQDVLAPYVDMNDRDFVKLSQKAVSDLFDYAVQTTQGLNKDIFKILIEKGGVASRLKKFMDGIAKDPSHPLYGNHIVGVDGIMKVLPSPHKGDDAVNNVRIRGLQNKAYDQNLIIWAFREIRDYLAKDPAFYDNIVELAILQSGLSPSAISFTSVIPYEDFEKQYHSVLMKLDSIANLENFAKLNVFQRNNWNNDDIVPQMRAIWIPTKEGKRYNPSMEFIKPESVKSAVRKGTIPPVMNVRKSTKEANFDHIVYSWEKQEELLPANWKTLYPKMRSYEAIKAIKAEMRAKGDYSYINKALFEKVKDKYGNPLETEYKNKSGVTVTQHVYKAINAWGDAQRANEFYDIERHSVIDNGMQKIIVKDDRLTKEAQIKQLGFTPTLINIVDSVNNNNIIELFTGKKTTEDKTSGVKGINISSYESGLGQKLSNFANIPINFRGKLYKSSEVAYQSNKKDLSDKVVKELMTEILVEKLSQHLELVREIKDRGGADFLNNSTHNLIKDGREIKSDRWTGKDGLFMQSLRDAYDIIISSVGTFKQLEEVPVSIASAETLNKVKEVIKKMGISIQSLNDYLKGNPNVDAKGANALADTLRGIIAVAEGKEDVALTEEMVHIATASLEQTNPQLITELISKIGNFKIYSRVFDAYKNNPAYQTKDGKPDIRKIKKEAVDKLIAELIINVSEGSTEFPELLEETNRSVVRTWWQRILDAIRSLYKKAVKETNIDIFQQAAQEIMKGEQGRIYHEIKEGVAELFNSSPELASIGTPKQYSAYLDSIFPDSKVKDILYRGDGNVLNKAINSTFGTGYYFTPNKSYAENFAEIAAGKDKGYSLYTSLLNLKNPLIYNETIKNYKIERSRLGKAKDKYKEYALNKLKNNEDIPYLSDLINDENTTPLYNYKDGKYFTSRNREVSIDEIKQNIDLQLARSVDDNVSVTTEKSDLENINKQLTENNDGIIVNIQEKYKDIKNEYIVFEPEQIHIIGSKQDIEGFREFVKNAPSEGIYFQYSDAQKKLQEKILYTKENVRKVEGTETADPLLMDSEEANNWYELNTPDGWERIKKRVTDRVKAWYKARFPDKDFTKEEKELNEFKRTEGIKGHRFFEEIHNRFFNPDGTKKEKATARPVITDPVDREMYQKLENYYVELMQKFFKNGKTPLVFSEVIVYDNKEKEAGTLDLVIIEEDGKANIIDWKFMNVSKESDDIPWYKQGAFNIQLSRYKEILVKQYGVKSIGMNRAIPILMDIDFRDYKDPNSKHRLKGIHVGSVDTSKISSLLLTPVSEESESTAVVMEGEAGFEKLDKLIAKLNSLYKQVTKKQVTNEEEREFKRDRLNAIKAAVRSIQGTANLTPLIKVISLMRAEGEQLVNDWNMKYKDVAANDKNLDNASLSDFAANIREYKSVADIFRTIDRTLGNLIYSSDMEKDSSYSKEDIQLRKDILKKIQEESRLIDESYEEISSISGKFADKFIGIRNLVSGLLDPKAIVKGLSATFRGVSELPLPSLRVLYKMVTNAKAYASQEALKEVNELMDIRKKLVDRGSDIRELVGKIYQKDDKDKLVNKLIYRYKKDFYDEIKNNALEGKRSKQWILDNVDMDAYKAQATEILDKRIERIKELYKDDGERIAELTLKEQRKFDINRSDFNGWNNYLLKRNPLEKWESDEYKAVKADADLLSLYNFIHKMNDKAVESGYISNRIASTFLPFVRKGMAESLAWDFSLSAVNNWSKQLTLRAGDVGYGQVNELTGEYEYAIPRYYTHDFTAEDGSNEQVSEDVFKNMILYINHMEKYKYLSDIEDQLLLVKNIEQFKKHLDTARNGDVVLDENGKPRPLEGNDENTRMFDTFLRAILYEQKYPLSSGDTPLNIGKVVNYFKAGINKVAGKEVYKIDDNPSVTSLIKTIDATNRVFQLKTLGFEFVSGAVNLFGLNIQMATQAGHYFTEKEFIKNEVKLLGNRFRDDDEREKFIQLVDLFMPMKDDPTYEKMKKAGMTRLTRVNFSDIIMWFMRNPELHAEKAIFTTLLQNMMVENGKIVSIPEYVKAKYKDRYSSADVYRSMKKVMDDEIEELKNTRSMDVTAKLEDGKLVIPGLNLNNREELQRLTNLTRRISRNATGGLSDADLNNMSLNIWTKSMMVFKNWIPKLVDTRFGEFRRVADDFSIEVDENELTTGEKYDIGRVRLFAGLVGMSVRDKGNHILNILKMNDKGIAFLDKMYDEYAAKYEKSTGETFTMTKEDFIDMVKTNLSNQMREFAMLLSLWSAAFAIGFIGPDDEDNRAEKNFFRFWQRVFDRFIQELSFFYNPVEFQKMLSGSAFPAIGLMSDVLKAADHVIMATTGLDISNLSEPADDVFKKAQPIKNMARLFPGTKSFMTYGAIFSEDFAKEFDITIQKETKR